MILCLDFETSALNEQRGSVLQIGAVWLHNAAEFFRECRPNDGNALVEDEALAVNGITNVHDQGRLPERLAIAEFTGWARGSMGANRKIQIAAWNAHFEHRHLIAAMDRAGIDHRYRPFAHRLIDLHSVLAVDRMRKLFHGQVPVAPVLELFGSEVANCDEASKMLDLPAETKPHNALAGAKQVRAMFRRLLGDMGALP